MKKIFLIMFLAILLVGSVSAGILDIKSEFKKVDSYNLNTKVIEYNNLWEKYAPIEIKSWLGLGETLFKGAIVEHTEVCGQDCFSTMEIYIPNEGSLVDGVVFKTLQENGRWVEQSIRNYQFEYLGLEGWVNYNLGEIVPAGEYTLKLTGEKKPSRTVDWIIDTQGKTLNSWAVWSEEWIWSNGSTDATHDPDSYSNSGNCFDENDATYAVKTFISGTPVSYTYVLGKTFTAQEIRNVTLKAIITQENSQDSKTIRIETYNGTDWNFSEVLASGGTDQTYDDVYELNDIVSGIRISLYAATNDNRRVWLRAYTLEYEVHGDAYILLNSPTDEYTTTLNENLFNASAIITDGATLVNMSLWTNETGSWVGYNSTDFPRYNLIIFDGEQKSRQSETYGIVKTISDINSLVAYATNEIKGSTGGGTNYCKYHFIYHDDSTQDVIETMTGNVWSEETYTNPLPEKEVKTIEISLKASSTQIVYERNDSIYSETYSLIINRTITNDIIWNVKACDSDADCGFAVDNYTLFLDTTFPIINVTSPTSIEDYGAVGENESLNWNVSDVNLDTCWYDYNGTNTTATCGDNQTNFVLEEGIYNLTFWVNDSVGNTNSSFVEWVYNIVANSQTYNNQTYETASETFVINTTASSSLTSANLIYNTVSHSSTKSGTIFTSTFDIPASTGNKEFYWDFIYAGGSIFSTPHNQTVSIIQLGICNATLTVPYINFSFKDEETTNVLNASLDTSTWSYWLGDGTYTKSLLFSNTTDNFYYDFCLSPGNVTMKNTRSLQYSKSGYPQRKYDASSDLTNSTTNKTLYLLSSADGIYSTIQVVDEEGDRVGGVEVTSERQFEGIWTIIGQEVTDDAGLVTFWLNPDYDHRFTFVDDDCIGVTVTIRPTQTQYTQQLQCGVGADVYVSQIEGIKYARTPLTGIIQEGVYNFTYQIVSSKDNIINASFKLVNSSTGVTLNSTWDACNPGGCILWFMYTFNFGDDVKGKYYVNVGNGSILLEGDARWRVVDIPTAGKAGMSTFWKDLKYVIDEWGDDSDTADFNRLVVIFFFMCLGISVLNYNFGNDTQNPGAFLMIMTIVILMGSIVGGTTGQGFFYFNNLTSANFINNYILSFFTLLITISYFININRQASR